MSFLRKHSVLLGFSSVAAIALAIGCSQSADEGASSSADDSQGDASTDAATTATHATQDLVISQVYGGGGNAGAAFSNDFVELFNRGDAAVGLKGVSLQYVGYGNNFLSTATRIDLPDVQLSPGHYFLIQLAGGGADAAIVGAPLPSPDYIAATPLELINMSKSDGKIALSHTATPLNNCGATGTLCDESLIIDLVGFGKASQYEGAPTISLDSTKAAIRKLGGCVAFWDNAYDFTIDVPAPRNGATDPSALCSTVDAGAAPPPPVPPVVSDGGTTTTTDGGSTTTTKDAGKYSKGGTTKGSSSSGEVIAPNDPAADGEEDPSGEAPTSAADGTVPPKFPATTPSCTTTMNTNGSAGLGAIFGLALVAGAMRRRKK